MEFDKVVRKRRSVRSYKAKRASWRDIIEAIDVAAHSPYAGNKNTVKYIITESDDTIKKIASACEQDWILDTGVVLIVVSDDQTLEEQYGERGRIYAHQQAGASIQSILLKLVDLGLASCWVGAFNERKLRNLFDIPDSINIEAVLPIGYEYGKTPEPYKRMLDTYAYWETWGKKRRPTLFTEPELHDNP